MTRARLNTVSAVVVLVTAVSVAYVWVTRQRSEPRLPARQAVRPSAAPAASAFIEVGPDQYKQTSACTDAEIELAIGRLRRQAVTQAEEAVETAKRSGMVRPLDPEFAQRVDALEADADALRRYLEDRQNQS